MLSDAKPVLENEIYNALKDALYKAQMNQFTKGENESLTKLMEGHMNKWANDFSDTAAKEAAPKIANAIYDFVKSIGITAIVKGTLTNTGGPVTGTINPIDFKIS